MPYDLRVLTRVTQISLAAQAAVSALSAMNGHRMSVVVDDPTSDLIALAQFAIFTITAIAFLTWTYRAKANGNAIGARGLSFSPAMSVGSYFIPLLNLIFPVQAMQELHKTSVDPRDWEAVGNSRMIWLWWLLWIVANGAGLGAIRLLTMDDALELADVAAQLSIASDVGTTFASLVLMRIVGTIAARLMHQREVAKFA